MLYLLYEIGGRLVEWDENKNQQNIRKHGISFQTAALVFAGEERIEYFDKLHSQYEKALRGSGICSGDTLCGLYDER